MLKCGVFPDTLSSVSIHVYINVGLQPVQSAKTVLFHSVVCINHINALVAYRLLSELWYAVIKPCAQYRTGHFSCQSPCVADTLSHNNMICQQESSTMTNAAHWVSKVKHGLMESLLITGVRKEHLKWTFCFLHMLLILLFKDLNQISVSPVRLSPPQPHKVANSSLWQINLCRNSSQVHYWWRAFQVCWICAGPSPLCTYMHTCTCTVRSVALESNVAVSMVWGW